MRRVEELETTLGELLGRVQSGETIVIASEGKDVAQISPCDPLAAMERAHPGIIRASKHMRDIELRSVSATHGARDSVAMLIEDRADREFLS